MDLNGIHPNWKPFFDEESKKEYFIELNKKLKLEDKENTIYPETNLRLRAFETTDPLSLKIVIMGQDCYFSTKSEMPEAVGLAFSVPKEMKKLPPSLKNIYKELARTVDGFQPPTHGSLVDWTKDTLLLNAVLSVRAGTAASHAKKMGWEHLTRNALKYLSDINKGFVYLGWGKFAHKQSELIDTKKHHVIKTSHPSPLGHYKNGVDFTAFSGSGCFTAANEWLLANRGQEMDWTIN